MENTGRFTSERVTTHGMSKLRVYTIWEHVKTRGTGKADKKTNTLYFDRGITVCDRWLKFANFFEDMGMPEPNQCIDRIDNNKGYYLENCRWATMKQQANNTRFNHRLLVNGIEKTVSEWADITNIKANTIIYRLIRGWSNEKAIQNKKHKTVATEKKELRQRNCLICNKLFIPRTSQVKNNIGKFCSQKCNGLSRL